MLIGRLPVVKLYDKHCMWDDNRYVDLWSFVHFLFGVLFVFLADFFEITLFMALAILTVLTVIWEMVEFVSEKTRELLSNRVTDVIFADIGFLFMYFLLLLNNVPKGVYIALFLLLSLIFISLNINGWNKYMERDVKQKN